MNTIQSSALSLLRWLGFLILFILGLIMCVWALRYYDVGLARAGNRKDILVLGLAFVGAGAGGALLNATNVTLKKLAPALLILVPIFAGMNLLIGSAHLDRQSYKVDSKLSHTLSSLSEGSPNKTIREGRHAYYVLRDEFRGRDYILASRSPAVRPVLFSIGGAKTVNAFQGNARDLVSLQARAAAMTPKHELELISGKKLWVMAGSGQTVYVLPNPTDENIWYMMPLNVGEK